MNKCIVIQMKKNAFVTGLKFKTDIVDKERICTCKIDTGCSHTTIPFYKFTLPKSMIIGSIIK